MIISAEIYVLLYNYVKQSVLSLNSVLSQNLTRKHNMYILIY